MNNSFTCLVKSKQVKQEFKITILYASLFKVKFQWLVFGNFGLLFIPTSGHTGLRSIDLVIPDRKSCWRPSSVNRETTAEWSKSSLIAVQFDVMRCVLVQVDWDSRWLTRSLPNLSQQQIEVNGTHKNFGRELSLKFETFLTVGQLSWDPCRYLAAAQSDLIPYFEYFNVQSWIKYQNGQSINYVGR